MKNKIKVGVIGLGSRGEGLLKNILLNMDDVEVVGVCDSFLDRAESGRDAVREKRKKRPLCTDNYMEILDIPDMDAVFILSAWESHIPIAIEALDRKKYVAMEVGGAYSINQCWELVNASERNKMPCMMLENCCYGKYELMILNMVNQGVFGEVIHCDGGYMHDLRREITFGEENRHYRLRNYKNRNCDNYPTHALGPIAKILDINSGNRMKSLVSVGSSSKGLHTYIEGTENADKKLLQESFAQSDVVTTVITCAMGQTIALKLDTTLPRGYSRGLQIHGTKAMYIEDNQSVFLDKVHDEHEFSIKPLWGNADEYYEKYKHSIWRQYEQDGIRGGHDGMDWLVFRAFVQSVKNGAGTPIDVYDTAAWMSVSALSEASIASGGQPVDIPDFTNGKWLSRKNTFAK